MALSKPVLHLLGSYLQNLYLYPIRTKSITSCVLASLANYSSQVLSGEKYTNVDSIVAFGLFGLFFGGPVPHFFFSFLERFVPAEGVRCGLAKQMIIERIIYTPLFQMLSLYTNSRLEGKDHKTSLDFMLKLLLPVLMANWKWLTVFQIINLTFVPPVLRVLYVNLVGFFWVMYLAKMRRDASRKPKKTAEN